MTLRPAPATGPTPSFRPLLPRASVSATHEDAADLLARRLGPDELDCALLFAESHAFTPDRVRDMQAAFQPARSVGCVTCGEIDETRYASGRILGMGLPRSHFRTRAVHLTEDEALSTGTLVGKLVQARNALAREVPDWSHDFAILMVDGQRLREEAVTPRIASALGPVPLVGTSAGDLAADPDRPRIFSSGGTEGCAALVLHVRGRCPVTDFRTDHLRPTDLRMVVTRADPARRLALEINGVPAAQEYARLLGLDPRALTPADFANHPLLVRVGSDHHVRSILDCTPDDALQFGSAVGVGMVLSLAHGSDLSAHLDRELSKLALPGQPDMVLGFDCLLRRCEAHRTGQVDRLSRILSERRVVGASSLGEQHGGMHLNHTLTGLAIYPPGAEREGG